MKNFLLFFISFVLLLSFIFTACSPTSNALSDLTQDTSGSYEALIKELEEKILELEKNSSLSDEESKKQLEELQNQLNELNSQASTTQATTTSTSLPESIFTYKLIDGKAIITGFTGKDEHIVIPSMVDGFEVYSISSNAFEGYRFKSVIISEGVEEIDWFAFYNCVSLSAITIPKSVKKIGHSAFSGCSKSFTIYCQSGSFAQAYAQSYGITYATV